MRKTTSKLASATPALLLLLALSACAEASNVEGVAAEGRCAICHLSSAADASTASGAHLRHLTAGAVGGPFTCGACHVVPATVAADGHRDGLVDVVPTTAVGVPVASWDRVSKTCTGSCHETASPIWTRTDGTQAQCGSCHGLPPAGGHPAINSAAGCNACHPATVRADGTIDVAGGKHVNGQLDFITNPACGACHAIPPSTGQHVLHVASVGIACGACHGGGATATNPGTNHQNGTVEVTVPGWAATRTCATACHGPERW